MARAVVTVGEFPNAILAELARGRLEEEGIEAEVSGAMAQTWGGGDVPLFGVRVEVRREDAERARAILDDVERRVGAGEPAVYEVGAAAPLADERGSPAEGSDERWSVERTGRAVRDALIVTLLSWVYQPLVTVAIALVIRAWVNRSREWPLKMQLSLLVAALLDLALAGFWLYLAWFYSPWYWLVPWPWFHTQTPWPVPDS